MKIMHFMFLKVFIVLCCTLSYGTMVNAEMPAPVSIVTDELKWTSPAPIAGLQFAWVQGNETDSGLYVLRVRLEPDAKIPPHSHPDQRLSTVLAGTLYVGFGDVFDETDLVAVEAGDAYVAPANIPHFIWASDGAVEYQETGLGPTATKIIKNN